MKPSKVNLFALFGRQTINIRDVFSSGSGQQEVFSGVCV
ncbi:hypothetical protein PC116_g4807 [Phytophthora cactorum]|nr:hypothetical protein PC114_g4706 [Phytophthora cactorum]KAG3190284.1 hypothetical protein C6341_g1764 [Phytophthora cactorum]KAG3203522.1 hypothetical protein PC128_g2565 [Phytophthora cactorum]KAG4247387.1 hypothetical protein PC116_g4807 [Phytophthora cactorum]